MNKRSCSGTPQQNGVVVERNHKHLLETTRSHLLQAKITPKYWGRMYFDINIFNKYNVFEEYSLDDTFVRLFHCKPYLTHLIIFG